MWVKHPNTQAPVLGPEPKPSGEAPGALGKDCTSLSDPAVCIRVRVRAGWVGECACGAPARP